MTISSGVDSKSSALCVQRKRGVNVLINALVPICIGEFLPLINGKIPVSLRYFFMIHKKFDLNVTMILFIPIVRCTIGKFINDMLVFAKGNCANS